MNMTEPSQNEKDRAIENILAKGLRKPRSMWASLNEIYRLLGFRYIFWDTAQAFVFTAVALAGVFLYISASPELFRHSVTFGCSPLLFVTIMVFSETVERTDGLYELKLTCKYTIRQITVFRIMCFSLLGIVFCVGVTAYQAGNAFLLSLPLSLSALFLCAFSCLVFARLIAGKLAYALAAVLWLAVSFAPVILFGDKWEMFLSGLPVAITVAAAILSLALFLLEIKKHINTREAFIYAFGQ